MAFPAVEATSAGHTASGTSHAITLASGLVNGELCIACIMGDTNVTAWAWPAGWTELFDTLGSSGTLSCSYRFADGTEGGSVTATSTGTATATYNTYRISGQHASSAPEVGTSATGSSTTPDPPSVTASWGAEDNLWLPVLGTPNNNTSGSAPTSYTNLLQGDSSSGQNCWSARRSLNAATEDPGTFTMSGGGGWITNTVVVRPSASSATAVARDIGVGIGRAGMID